MIRAITPYVKNGMWVFDDPDHNIVEEAFIMGASEMITRAAGEFLGDGVIERLRVVFSDKPFPGVNLKLVRMEGECSGYWYDCPEFDMRGWLCAVVEVYFGTHPKELYLTFEPAS